MSRKKQSSPSEDNLIAQLIAEGRSISSIARELNRSYVFVWKRVQESALKSETSVEGLLRDLQEMTLAQTELLTGALEKFDRLVEETNAQRAETKCDDVLHQVFDDSPFGQELRKLVAMRRKEIFNSDDKSPNWKSVVPDDDDTIG